MFFFSSAGARADIWETLIRSCGGIRIAPVHQAGKLMPLMLYSILCLTVKDRQKEQDSLVFKPFSLLEIFAVLFQQQEKRLIESEWQNAYH